MAAWPCRGRRRLTVSDGHILVLLHGCRFPPADLRDGQAIDQTLTKA
jgi:hypothetical protein